MNYSSLIKRLWGEASDAWAIHGRAKAMQQRGEDVILLSIGDPDFDTPAPITEAAISALRAGRTHYTGAGGIMPFREAVASHHAQTTGQAVSAENVVIVPGAQCGLFCAVMCVVEPGDEIIVPEPMYVTYEGVVGTSGAKIVPVPLKPEHEFHLDPADLEAAITPRTRALLLNTPHNPTGAVMRLETIEAVAELARRRDFWVITDEVYSQFTFDRPHVSPASVELLWDRCVTIASLSKSFAMTGWRIGWLVAPVELASHMEGLLGCMLYGSPGFIQEAAVRAISGDIPEVTEMHEEYQARRDLVLNLLAPVAQISCHRPEAGMYIMIDIRETGLDGKAFADLLLDHGGVSLLPGEAFGQSAAGHMRFSLCAPCDQLSEACQRIAAFVSTLEPSRSNLG